MNFLTKTMSILLMVLSLSAGAENSTHSSSGKGKK